MKLIILLLSMFSFLQASDALTVVSDTLYAGDGTTLNGSFSIDFPSMTLPGGTTVQKGTQTYNIVNGVLNISLYPNTIAYPSGTSYRVSYSLLSSAGTISYKEYWVIPSSTTPVTVASVRTTSIPVPNLLYSCNQLPGGCPVGTVANYKTFILPTNSSSLTILASQHLMGPNILIQAFDSNGVTVELNYFLDPSGNFSANWDVPFTFSGSLVFYSGTPNFKNYSGVVNSMTTYSLIGGTTSINNSSYTAQCWNSNDNSRLDFNTLNIDSSLNVTLDFGSLSSARCVFGLLQ